VGQGGRPLNTFFKGRTKFSRGKTNRKINYFAFGGGGFKFALHYGPSTTINKGRLNRMSK
jgi:hypothetical protein